MANDLQTIVLFFYLFYCTFEERWYIYFMRTKEKIAQQILAAPFNWTGLTLSELVEAGRIPADNVDKCLRHMVQEFFNEKYKVGDDLDIDQYLQEKEELYDQLCSEWNHPRNHSYKFL